MKTDRELLELAAKAAGYRLEWDGPPDKWQPMYYEGKTYHSFDPLTDDGDALRLAVKLQLQITPGTYNNEQFSAFHAGRGEANEWRSFLQDDCASTRRAIVRAAAAIGERLRAAGHQWHRADAPAP